MKNNRKTEDYNIITPDNKICNFIEWMRCPNMVDNVSENPYPVMYVENKPVYEGDKLLFETDKNQKIIREVKWQHRALINQNKEWIKDWSFKLK